MDNWKDQNEYGFQTDEMHTENLDGETENPKKSGMKGKAGIAGVIGILLLKMKGILGIGLSLLKGGFILVKSMKFLGTFVSMLLTVLVYSKSYGFPFALGFVLLIFFHELGHLYMAKEEGLDVSAPMFIPFAGAFIRMKELPKTAESEAKIAIGGPLLGTIATVACLGVYWITNRSIFIHLAYTGFLINLFNLIPMTPLDGGRIAGAISPKIWVVGLIIAGVVMYWAFSPMLLIIIIFGGKEAYYHWKNPKPEYFVLSPETKGVIMLLYFGLVSFLGAGMALIYHSGIQVGT